MFKIKWKLYYKWWSSVHPHLTLCSGCRKRNVIFQNSLITDFWVVLHFIVMSSLHTQSRYQVHCVLTYILDTLEKAYCFNFDEKRKWEKKINLTTSGCLNWVHHCLKRKIMVNLFESNSIAWSMFIQCSPKFETHPKFKSSFNSLVPTMKQNMLYISYYPCDKLFDFIHLENNNYFSK